MSCDMDIHALRMFQTHTLIHTSSSYFPLACITTGLSPLVTAAAAGVSCDRRVKKRETWIGSGCPRRERAVDTSNQCALTQIARHQSARTTGSLYIHTTGPTDRTTATTPHTDIAALVPVQANTHSRGSRALAISLVTKLTALITKYNH